MFEVGMNLGLKKIKKRKFKSKYLYSELLNPPVVLSREDTIYKIINDKSSIARFGDGEFNMMRGRINWISE